MGLLGVFEFSLQALAALWENDQVALTYRASENPNGSIDDIAGICDPSGLIL